MSNTNKTKKALQAELEALQKENLLLKKKSQELEHIMIKFNELETQFKDLTSSIPVAVYQFQVNDDGKYEITFVSKSAEAIYQVPHSKLMDMEYITARVLDEDRAEFLQSIADAVSVAKSWSQEYRILLENGERKWIYGTSNPRKSVNDRYVWNGILMDITKQKDVESALELNAERYQKAQEIGHVGNWEYNLETAYFWGSEEARRIFAFPEDVKDLSTDMVENCIPERERVHQALIDLIEQEKPYDLTYEIISMTKGERKYLNSQAELLKNEQGNPLKIIGVVQDITKRYYAEQDLKNSLKEKETLLRELYHRTNNNMQVISSLLSLQANRSQNNTVLNIIEETTMKIKAIALVHQKLYQSQNLSSIELKNYFEELLDLILKSYSKIKQIEVETELETFNVLIDVAIPCGLILNELVTNSIKHAFQEYEKGKIIVKLRRSESGYIQIEYKDTGMGTPDDFDFRNTDTIGLQTVISIGEHQLSGQVTFHNNPGITCNIIFPDTIYSERV